MSEKSVFRYDLSTIDDKLKKRIIKNRISAEKSRQKKKNELIDLNEKLEIKTKEYDELEKKLKEKNVEYDILLDLCKNLMKQNEQLENDLYFQINENIQNQKSIL